MLFVGLHFAGSVLVSCDGSAPYVGGEYRGAISEESGRSADVSLTLEQTDDDRLSGSSSVDLPDAPDGDAELRADSGSVESNRATRFAGTIITQQDGPVTFDYAGAVSEDRRIEGQLRILEDGDTVRLDLERQQ